MASSKRKSAAAQQAQLEAFVKYSPEASALQSLLSGTKSDFKLGVRQEGAIRGVLQRGARTAIPAIEQSYDRAADTRAAAQAPLDADLARLGPAAAGYAASSARERAGHVNRTAESKAGAVSALRQRITDADAGEASAVRQLRAAYRSDRSKIEDRLVQLGREQGAFTAASTNSILEQIRRDDTTRRGQTLSAEEKRADRASRETIAANAEAGRNARDDGPAGSKKKRLTPDQQQKRLDAVNEARSWFAKLRGQGRSMHDVYAALRTGKKDVYREVKDSAGKVHLVSDPVPKLGNDWINAGADLHTYGYLSATNYKRLRKRGIAVPREWRPRRISNGKINRPVGSRPG